MYIFQNTEVKMRFIDLAAAYFGEAMINNDLERVVKVLRKTPEVVHYVDTDIGSTPLFAAAGLGRVAVCSQLLRYGADVDKGHQQAGSPIFAATAKGHHHVCTLLLRNGAKVIN